MFCDRRDIPEPEPEPVNSVEGIYPSLREFKDSQEDTDPVLRNMDANMLQRLKVLALQAIKRLEAGMQEMSASK